MGFTPSAAILSIFTWFGVAQYKISITTYFSHEFGKKTTYGYTEN
jgi:hypothetical protein